MKKENEQELQESISYDTFLEIVDKIKIKKQKNKKDIIDLIIPEEILIKFVEKKGFSWGVFSEISQIQYAFKQIIELVAEYFAHRLKDNFVGLNIEINSRIKEEEVEESNDEFFNEVDMSTLN